MAVPLQMVWDAGVAVMAGAGLTVICDVVVAEQLPEVAVIVNVTTTAAFVVLTKVPEMLFPLPDAANPVAVAVLFLVQLKVVPGTAFGLEMFKAEKAIPEQTVWFAGVTETDGCGFTVMETVVTVDIQVAAEAVIVKIVVCATFVVLTNVPEMLAPVPEAAIPVIFEALSRVQL